jgi:hypothetical protein
MARKNKKSSKHVIARRERVVSKKPLGFTSWLKEDLKRTTRKEYRWLLWLAVILVIIGLFILSLML